MFSVEFIYLNYFKLKEKKKTICGHKFKTENRLILGIELELNYLY